MTHCQVQVADGTNRVYTLVNDDGNTVVNPTTHYCRENPKYVCDSGFKFCAIHKKSHGTRGKDGHTHSFKPIKKVKP